MTNVLFDATRALLEALDMLDSRPGKAGEQAVEDTIKRLARRYAVDAQTLWDSACEVEPDPIERHRPQLNPDFKPVLR